MRCSAAGKSRLRAHLSFTKFHVFCMSVRYGELASTFASSSSSSCICAAVVGSSGIPYLAVADTWQELAVVSQTCIDGSASDMLSLAQRIWASAVTVPIAPHPESHSPFAPVCASAVILTVHYRSSACNKPKTAYTLACRVLCEWSTLDTRKV